MSPFDRLGRFVARRAWLVVGAWALVLLAALPLAPARPGRPVGRRLHPRRPRIGPGEGPPRTRARPPAVGAGHRLQQPDARGRDARVRRRRGGGRRRHRERPARRPRRPAPAVARGRSRPTATPPTTSSSSTCRPTTRPRPCRSSASGCTRRPGSTSSWPAARRSTATSRRVSEADLRRSEVISLPLAALALLLVFGSAVAAGVPLIVGGTAVVVALAGDLPGRGPSCR